METWIEYGVQLRTGQITPVTFTREGAEAYVKASRIPAIVVGRQVTASDWLPVDNGPAPATREDQP